MSKSNEFRVDISRPLKPIGLINGLPVVQDSGMNYVDVYFPDGSERTWGYIGRVPCKGSQFAPLSGCKQALSVAIQDEINKQLGCSDDEAAEAPATEELPPEDEESDEDE